MTDPHDRPYTFGWHGEIIRASHCAQPVPCPTGGCPCGDEIRDETKTRETR